MAEAKTMPPIHPGEILREEFLVPMGITANRLALDIGVSPSRVHEILKGKRSISAETALRLGRYFNDIGPEFWLNLQQRYDLEVARDALADRIVREVRIRETA
jgi:addiction module HigA family antidote